MTEAHAGRTLVPCEAVLVGLDHLNPTSLCTFCLSLFPAAPSVSNLFSEAIWEKGMFTYLCSVCCLLSHHTNNEIFRLSYTNWYVFLVCGIVYIGTLSEFHGKSVSHR